MNKVETGSFILRLTLGIAFLIHGLAKLQMGLGNVAGWFQSLGIPGFMGYTVAFVELLGGLALIIGLGTRIVSAIIAVLMIGAIFTAKLSAGFLGNGEMAGYELDLAFFAMAVFLVINGSRLFAVDKLLVSNTRQN